MSKLVESLSGVRGIWGKSLDAEVVLNYAHSYINFMIKNYKLVSGDILIIGRDSRVSGFEISSIIADIWTKAYGVKIVDVGIVPTPVVELAVREYGAKGGVIITASHNEPEFNGFKFLSGSGGVMYARDMNKIIYNVHNKPVNIGDISDYKTAIENRHDDIILKYIKFLKDIVGEVDFSGMSVLLDPNGGAAAACVDVVCDAFGLNYITKGMNLGQFWRKVEPRQDTIYSVVDDFDDNTQFAACFDCDADRVEMVDRTGDILSGQKVVGLMFQSLLPNSGEKIVVTNDATSGLVSDIAHQYNIDIQEVEVGEANVVEKMEGLGVKFGAEGSSGGGIINPGKCRDGILSFLVVAKLISQSKKTLNQLLSELPQYKTIAKKFTGISVSDLRSKFVEYAKCNNLTIKTTGDETGGMKILFDNSHWLWVRASKTEADTVRIIADGQDNQKVLDILQIAQKWVD